jgi:hypothetical protein
VHSSLDRRNDSTHSDPLTVIAARAEALADFLRDRGLRGEALAAENVARSIRAVAAARHLRRAA